MSKDLLFFFLRKTRETERELREETLEGRPWEVRGAGGRKGCPGVLEVPVLTPLSALVKHVGWQSGEGMEFRSMPSHPGTSLHCHVLG